MVLRMMQTVSLQTIPGIKDDFFSYTEFCGANLSIFFYIQERGCIKLKIYFLNHFQEISISFYICIYFFQHYENQTKNIENM